LRVALLSSSSTEATPITKQMGQSDLTHTHTQSPDYFRHAAHYSPPSSVYPILHLSCDSLSAGCVSSSDTVDLSSATSLRHPSIRVVRLPAAIERVERRLEFPTNRYNVKSIEELCMRWRGVTALARTTRPEVPRDE
jgi:hypothetical protein